MKSLEENLHWTSLEKGFFVKFMNAFYVDFLAFLLRRRTFFLGLFPPFV